MDWHRPIGKKPIPINTKIEKAVLDLSSQLLHRGLHKMHESLLLDQYDDIRKVSQSDVKKVFTKHIIFKEKRKPRSKSPKRCRYHADYANMIWHTDLHCFKKDKQVIVWLDDKSRMVLKHKFLKNKQAESAKEALKEVFSLYQQPYAIWTDNGTEFKGVFHDFLNEKGIIHIFTDAYNPEQNGKCERFWQTLENAKTEIEVPKLLDAYNACPHFGLPIINQAKGNRHMTPSELWKDLDLHFSENKQPTWTINGESGLPFP
jgi:hypothetical protein